ncbi:hypothetical protein [Allomuricauda sp. R78024]|uniref:hypothetical protein n=1 Tax=Allomuricauda sp. R78024 TaxID=3093867 RepID=UPI0037C90F6B
MKVKVVKEFEAKIFEVSQLEEHSIPGTYQKPYFIVVESREDIRVPFQFHARKEILRKSGKTKYFDSTLINAQEYESFSHALAVANKFKKYDFSPGQQFYVVGVEQARIIQMKNEEENKKMIKAFERLKSK